MENKVTVSICGQDYTFVAEESPSYMQKVGSYVDTKMDEMLTGTQNHVLGKKITLRSTLKRSQLAELEELAEAIVSSMK